MDYRMTPLYTGNDYYKKMLDLQERLRKSEEERIRLEERFSLLEHESRSRHETCINRLRMRYIDFLEEQQSRDERNHQLLGALDRVDSSLALMSAKTDRLGALRKQYEASIMASYENRRPTGSVTGDSGVASQNDIRQRRSNELSLGNRNEPLLLARGIPAGHQVSANRLNSSPSRVRAGSSYSSNWSGIRCENSQVSPFAFSRLPQGATSLVSTRENGSSASFIDTSDDPRSLSRNKNSQSYQNRETIHQNSPAYDYRVTDSTRYAIPEYPLLQSTINNNLSQKSLIPASSSKYTRSVVRDLTTSGAYESEAPVAKFFDGTPGNWRGQNDYERVGGIGNLRRNDVDNILRENTLLSPGQNSFSDDLKNIRSASSRWPKLSEILRQELGDEEEYVGSMVENQLERYISKIRSLHREAEPQSLEEIDHEQNTSGDLLNVTLSDDGLDLPEEKRELPRELGNILAIANDLANQTATSAINVANNIYQNVPAGDERSTEMVTHNEAKFVIEPSPTRPKNNEPTDTVHQLASINRLLDDTKLYEDANSTSFEKIALPAKNGISVNVARSSAELATQSCKNIANIAKLRANSRESDLGKIESRRIGANSADNVEPRNFVDGRISNEFHTRESSEKMARHSSNVREFEKSRQTLMSGEEREEDKDLYDTAEDLEPWNLSALERKVQEIILNDEAEDDFILKAREVDETLRPAEQTEHAISGIYDEWDNKPRTDGQKIDVCKTGNDETSNPNGSRKEETRTSHEKSSIDGDSAKSLPMKNEQYSRLEQYENLSSVVAEESINQLPREYTEGSREGENIEESNYVAGVNPVDPGLEYGAKEIEEDFTNRENEVYVVQGENAEDTNLGYEYNAHGEYHEDPNEPYQQYDSSGNARYDGDQNGGYGYEEQKFENQYVNDPNQQGYAQDHNQQEYAADPNQQYLEDPNQQYSTDSNQQYSTDPNQQYSADPNQQYSTDPNQQYAVDPNQPEYVQDPNQQYSTDSNEQYSEDPNREYTIDPNQQYSTEPKQEYPIDPNQQYSADPNQEYPNDPNQEYPSDPNQEYPSDPNQEYPSDPHQEYSAEVDPAQQYIADSNQEYSAEVDPNQQYPPEVMYAQDENTAYLPTGTDYYPETQEYQNNENYVKGQEGSTITYESTENVQDPRGVIGDNEIMTDELDRSASASETKISPKEETTARKTKDVIKSLLESDTESTIERNVSNTESDFDFN